jgi:hypothetical protein
MVAYLESVYVLQSSTVATMRLVHHTGAACAKLPVKHNNQALYMHTGDISRITSIS